MATKVQRIISGWKNYILEDGEIEQMARNRAAQCSRCPFANNGLVAELIGDKIQDIKGYVCSKCNCPLSAKLRSPDEVCPIDKW